MNEKVIKLNKNNILRLAIETNEGNKTGKYLEFDLEDIELPLKYQELVDKDKKNKEFLRNQLLIIDKKQDFTKKGQFLSNNEKEKIKAINNFFNKEVEIYNMFLGENGVQKLLNGRKIGWTTLQEIDDIIGKQIQPYLETNMKDITELVKEKYGKGIVKDKEQVEVIE